MNAALRLMRGMEHGVEIIADAARNEYAASLVAATHFTIPPTYQHMDDLSEADSAAEVEQAVIAFRAAYETALDVMEEHQSAWHAVDESEMEAGDET